MIFYFGCFLLFANPPFSYFRDLPNQNGVLMVCAQEMDDGQRESLHIVCRGIELQQSQSPLCALCMGGSRQTFLELHRQMDDGR